MAQYLVTKLDPTVRHIRKNCPDIVKAIEEGRITKDDVVKMDDDMLAAHRKKYGNGMGDDGFPVESGRCPTCWNIKTTRSDLTPNQREAARLERITARAEAKAVKEQEAAAKAAEKAAAKVESKSTETTSPSTSTKSPVTRKKETAKA